MQTHKRHRHERHIDTGTEQNRRGKERIEYRVKEVNVMGDEQDGLLPP